MALRIKASIAFIVATLPLAAQSYQVHHAHWRRSCVGTLTISQDGILFDERTPVKKGKPPHHFTWAFADMQQLLMEPKRITILTYEDVISKFGVDRQYTFELQGDATFDNAYASLKNRLDQRFVSAIPDSSIQPIWKIAVKHELGYTQGSQGILAIGEDRIVYRTENQRDSRTWRYSDIDNISMEGPFQLTLTTFERERTHYGNRKSFNFQLKEALSEARFNDLWQRLEKGRSHGILTQKETNQ